jgi:UDP-3-O-[3-hydroxymyristoyl] glucosamine N-acyltransferase
LADGHGGAVDSSVRAAMIRRLAPLDDAALGAEDLCPLTSRRHVERARASDCALLVDASLASLVPEGRRWIHPYASFALAKLLTEIDPAPSPARDARAAIDPTATLAPNVAVGPFAVIGAGVVIGPCSIIEAHAVIYPRVRIGARVVVGAQAVVGRPGFGFAAGPDGALLRIPQLGGVEIEDDVEIGPLSTIDAGTLAPTILRRGTRLDAQVHVGHNAQIGPLALVAAQSGFAGSVIVGAGVRIGGQAGIADHVRIGDGVQIAAKAGVIGDVGSGVVAGYPAVERKRWLRGMARLLRRENGRK